MTRVRTTGIRMIKGRNTGFERGGSNNRGSKDMCSSDGVERQEFEPEGSKDGFE